jgi:hypothetical protein
MGFSFGGEGEADLGGGLDFGFGRCWAEAEVGDGGLVSSCSPGCVRIERSCGGCVLFSMVVECRVGDV